MNTKQLFLLMAALVAAILFPVSSVFAVNGSNENEPDKTPEELRAIESRGIIRGVDPRPVGIDDFNPDAKASPAPKPTGEQVKIFAGSTSFSEIMRIQEQINLWLSSIENTHQIVARTQSSSDKGNGAFVISIWYQPKPVPPQTALPTAVRKTPPAKK